MSSLRSGDLLQSASYIRPGKGTLVTVVQPLQAFHSARPFQSIALSAQKTKASPEKV